MVDVLVSLLIEPQGIEMKISSAYFLRRSLLIEPQGIEINRYSFLLGYEHLLLIEPQGIEIRFCLSFPVLQFLLIEPQGIEICFIPDCKCTIIRF